MSIRPPLTDSELENTPVDIERHRAPDPEPVVAIYDVQAEGEAEPRVEVTHVDGGRWQVRVEVDAGSAIRAAGVEAVVIPRDVLAADLPDASDPALRPSIPENVELAFTPELRGRAEGFRIRFGDLRYSPTTIFQPDGRRAYYDERYPWCCLVRITTPRGWAGSGVLIGPRHVLTASHVVDWTPGWARVDVLHTDGRSLAAAGATYAYAETRVGPGQISDADSDEDYAVLVLDQRLGDRFGWLGCRTYDSGWDDEQEGWRSIGYPQDWSATGETAAYQRDFLLNELGADFGSARLIRSDTFDNWPGQSGSPVFGFWEDGPYAVGVVSGEGSDYNYISGGSLLPSIVVRARNDNP